MRFEAAWTVPLSHRAMYRAIFVYIDRVRIESDAILEQSGAEIADR